MSTIKIKIIIYTITILAFGSFFLGWSYLFGFFESSPPLIGNIRDGILLCLLGFLFGLGLMYYYGKLDKANIEPPLTVLEFFAIFLFLMIFCLILPYQQM